MGRQARNNAKADVAKGGGGGGGGGVVGGRNHGREAWKCMPCSNSVPFPEGKWNPAQKLQCLICSKPPNKSCILWGDGMGKNGGKWAPGNGHRGTPNTVPGSPPPSVRTAAGQQGQDLAKAKRLEQEVQQLRAEKKNAWGGAAAGSGGPAGPVGDPPPEKPGGKAAEK